MTSETDKGRNGDAAWPLWGLAMRIMQAVSQRVALSGQLTLDGIT